MSSIESIQSIYLFAGDGLSQIGVDTISVGNLRRLLQQHYPHSPINLSFGFLHLQTVDYQG